MKQELLFDLPVFGLNENDIVYTPEHIAKDVVDHFRPSGKCLDPCKGNGAFYKYLPQGSDWCEIRQGRDFFKYDERVDWIISNPPFSLYFEWLLHSFEISQNIVYLLPMGKVFQSYRNLLAIKKYGDVKECYVIGTGRMLGWGVGFAIGAIHFKRNFSGKTLMSFRMDNNRFAGEFDPLASVLN